MTIRKSGTFYPTILFELTYKVQISHANQYWTFEHSYRENVILFCMFYSHLKQFLLRPVLLSVTCIKKFTQTQKVPYSVDLF